jgi:hypothetical protein
VNGPSPAVGRTFNDDAREQEYRRSGMVVVPTPVFDAGQVAFLRELSERTAPPDDEGIVIDYRRDDRARIHEATATIGPMLADAMTELFADHRLVVATFIVKYPDEQSAMVLHEDRTHVDERVHRAGNLWIPLDDVGPGVANGGIEVLPRSHLLASNLVGTRTPDLWRRHEPFLRHYLVRPDVPAGAAVYYDNRTLHASAMNETTTARVALACLIVPRSAKLRHVVSTGRRHRVVYAVDDAFFLDTPPHKVSTPSMQPYDVLYEIDEADEDIALDPIHVVSVIAGDAPDAPVEDLLPDEVSPPAGVKREPRRLPANAVDPPEPTADLDATETSVDGFLRTTANRGCFDLFVLSGPADRRQEPPAWANAVAALDLDERWAAIIVLAEGALVDLEVALDEHPRDHWDLEVIDVPWAATYVGVDGASELLDNDHDLVIRSPRAALWNHGPGNAAVLISAVAVNETAPPVPAYAAPAAASEAERPPDRGVARLGRSLRRLARR